MCDFIYCYHVNLVSFEWHELDWDARLGLIFRIGLGQVPQLRRSGAVREGEGRALGGTCVDESCACVLTVVLPQSRPASLSCPATTKRLVKLHSSQRLFGGGRHHCSWFIEMILQSHVIPSGSLLIITVWWLEVTSWVLTQHTHHFQGYLHFLKSSCESLKSTNLKHSDS